MNRRKVALSVLSATAILALLASPPPLEAQFIQNNPVVIQETKHDTSAPLRTFPAVVSHGQNRPVLPLRRRPESAATLPQIAQPDPVLQTSPGALAPATTSHNFDGIAADGLAPPDTNGSVGDTQYVQTVNVEYAVYNKANGALLYGPTTMHTLWSGFGGLCETGNLSDPVVLYDKGAGRWFVSIVAFNNNLTQFVQCMAVSTSSDATGSYNRYAFSFSNNLNDYPKFGVWPDAYYASYNMFRSAILFGGARACAYNRAAMLAGQTATGVCFQRSTSDFSLLPSDLDGTTAPPTGSPNYFLELDGTSNTIMDIYQFHVDFTTPSNSTFTGPVPIAIAPWTQLCPTTQACIAEPSPGEKLDALGDRLMYRLAYRNFGDHESLVVNHTVDRGGGIAAVRWYEIRSPGSAPYVFQQGTFGANVGSFWMGSVGMDKAGDIALGFSVSNGSNVDPSIAYTARLSSDTPGRMRAPNIVIRGSGVQEQTSNRWGDYSSMSIDPTDDCTFWYTQEYYKTTGSFNWNTRIASFKVSGCQ